MGALLEIRELEVRFGAVEAVRGVSLSVDEGEVLGLAGESGSGKSATALASMGLLPPTARTTGQILWKGAGEDARTTAGGTPTLQVSTGELPHPSEAWLEHPPLATVEK